MPVIEGVDNFTLEELEELFKEEVNEQTPPPANNETNPPVAEPSNDTNVGKDATKAFAKRLAEEKAKVVKEERESIAKSLGFNSFDELQKSRERKLLEDKGLDPEEVSPILNELVEQKLKSDPRMKELEKFRAQQVEEFGKKELAEITKLTDGEITSLAQLPTEVIDLWKKKGSLKSAYLELKGEELILKAKSAQSKGTTSHLANPSGGNGPTNKRHLTEQEKALWRFFNTNMTAEELDKKMVDDK